MQSPWSFLLLYLCFITLVSYMCWNKPEPEGVVRSKTSGLDYGVFIYDSVLTAGECKRLVDIATPRLFRSQVNDDAKTISNVRTSHQAWISKNDSEVGDIVWKLMKLASRLTGVNDENMFEELQVARYEPSQEYKPHYDACVSDDFCTASNKLYRRATLIVYLADGCEGGETYFPNIDVKVKPEVGKGVLFYNTDADTGMEIKDSLHAGLPVKKGVKWIANLWIKYDPTKRCAQKAP